jgi:hypothetical protein
VSTEQLTKWAVVALVAGALALIVNSALHPCSCKDEGEEELSA